VTYLSCSYSPTVTVCHLSCINLCCWQDSECYILECVAVDVFNFARLLSLVPRVAANLLIVTFDLKPLSVSLIVCFGEVLTTGISLFSCVLKIEHLCAIVEFILVNSTKLHTFVIAHLWLIFMLPLCL